MGLTKLSLDHRPKVYTIFWFSKGVCEYHQKYIGYWAEDDNDDIWLCVILISKLVSSQYKIVRSVVLWDTPIVKDLRSITWQNICNYLNRKLKTI